MNLERTDFELPHPCGELRVVGRVENLPGTERRPFVLLVHGHRAFASWAFFPELSKRLAAAGFACLSFNFSGSGVSRLDPDRAGSPSTAPSSTAPAPFDRPDAFARNTYSQELDDLKLLRSAVEEGRFSTVDPRRGALFGHSRGGGMAILHTVEFARARGGQTGIEALALWAPMHRVALFGETSRRAFRDEGHLLSPVPGGALRLERAVLDDAERNAKRLDIPAAARAIDAPTLLVYGARDRLLQEGGAASLRQHLRPAVREEVIVEGGNHTLGARDPLVGIPPMLEEGLGRTVAWFESHVGR